MTNNNLFKNVMVWNGIDSDFQCCNLSIRRQYIDEIVVNPYSPTTSQTQWIIPAYTDCHIHLVNYAIAGKQLFLDGLSLEKIQQIIRKTAEETPRNQWIRGRGWEISHRQQGGFPDRLELDSVTNDHPIVLSSKDGHAIWLNSYAMKLTDITDDIHDPTGGLFLRRSDESLTGVALENAVEIIRRRLPVISDHEIVRYLDDAFSELHKRGIVAVHTFEGVRELDLLVSRAESGKLPLKVLSYFNLEDFETIIERQYLPGQKLAGIQIAGLKLFADGALGSKTAHVSQPYIDEPENFGVPVMDLSQLEYQAMRAGKYSFPTAIHAIGDRAVGNALKALSRVKTAYPEVKGLRIEHAQLIAREDLAQFHKHGITCSVQPCHMLSDIDMVERYWSNQKAFLYPYHSLDVSGAQVVFGSDGPIDDETPAHYLDAAIYRQKFDGVQYCESWIPNECMNSVNALKASTSTPVMLEYNSNRGCLIPGNSADFLVLNTNPFRPGTRYRDVKITAVYMNGIQIQ